MVTGKGIYNSHTLLIPLTTNWPLTTVLVCLLGHSLIFQVSFMTLWAQNWAASLCIQFSGNTWAWASSFSLQTDKISVPMWLEMFSSGALFSSLGRALPCLSLLHQTVLCASLQELVFCLPGDTTEVIPLLGQDHPEIQGRISFMLSNRAPLCSCLAVRSLKDTGTMTYSYTHVFFSSIPNRILGFPVQSGLLCQLCHSLFPWVHPL